MKKKKIRSCNGNLNNIFILNDWRKNTGIKASTKEMNMGLATRDYSVKCESGSEPLMLVEGNWIWWCYPHNQPRSRCEHAKISEKLNKIKEVLETCL